MTAFVGIDSSPGLTAGTRRLPHRNQRERLDRLSENREMDEDQAWRGGGHSPTRLCCSASLAEETVQCCSVGIRKPENARSTGISVSQWTNSRSPRTARAKSR
jgi:hypothetical protein